MSALDIKKWADKTGADLGSAVIAIKMELFSGVILNSRVLTGRFRGNWQTQTGGGIFNIIDRDDKEGGQPIAEATENVTIFGIDHMTNNLPYAAYWNERDGIIDGQIARVEANIAKLIKT